jgi:hypothetical protein
LRARTGRGPVSRIRLTVVLLLNLGLITELVIVAWPVSCVISWFRRG